MPLPFVSLFHLRSLSLPVKAGGGKLPCTASHLLPVRPSGSLSLCFKISTPQPKDEQADNSSAVLSKFQLCFCKSEGRVGTHLHRGLLGVPSWGFSSQQTNWICGYILTEIPGSLSTLYLAVTWHK